MSRVSRWGPIAAMALAALALTGCASLRVSSFAEPGFNFSQYRSYNWAPEDQLATGDPRLDNNQFFQERILLDVEKGLAARGFEKATAGVPGLILHYHASISQEVDVNAADKSFGYCGDCQPSLYDAGTLTLDLVDARTSRLVWRGWSEGSLDGIENQAFLERRVDEAIARILEQLPHRL